MAKLMKRGQFYHFDFRWQGRRFQGSTFLKNKEKAESYLAAYRTNLVLTRVGLVEKAPAPILKTFLEGKFLAWVNQQCPKPRTRAFYAENVKRLLDYRPFHTLPLDKITDDLITEYKQSRTAKRLSVATINNELCTLRKALRYADKCGLIRYQPFSRLPGETNRTFILDGETENRYLGLAEYPLRQCAILMLDLGLRPEECVRLRKLDISDEAVNVQSGKTPNARRSLPHTIRAKAVFALCFALFPSSEWVFPGRQGQHYSRGAMANLHAALRKAHGFPPEFLLYSCRHTFGTRLAEATNGDVFAIKEAMGHSSVKVSEKYVHPSGSYLALAFKRKEMLDKLMRGEADPVTTEITAPAKKERI